MFPLIFILISNLWTLNPVVSKVKCSDKISVSVFKNQIILHSGKTVKFKKPLRMKSSLKSCKFFYKNNLLYLNDGTVKWLFSRHNKSWKLLSAVYVSPEEDMTSELFDEKTGELFVKLSEARLCNNTPLKIYRKRYSVQKNKFISVSGTSYKFPLKFKTLKAIKAPDNLLTAPPLIKWKADFISSWQGAEPDYESPSPQYLSDGKRETAWFGDTSSGKGTFVTLRASTSYEARALTFYNGFYKNKKTFVNFNKLKTFYVTDGSNTVYKIKLPETAASFNKNFSGRWYVKFPEPLKGRCINIIFETFFDKPGKIPAISDFTFYSTLDFTEKPFEKLINDYKKEKISSEFLRKTMRIIPDKKLSEFLQRETLPSLRKILILTAARRNNPEFYTYIKQALTWNEQRFRKELISLLASKNQHFIINLMKDANASKSIKSELLPYFLRIDTDHKVVSSFIKGSYPKDMPVLNIIKNRYPKNKRADFLNFLCSGKSITSGVLWLGAKWASKSSTLKPVLKKCLKSKLKYGFAYRMRYIMATEVIKESSGVKLLEKLYGKDKRLAVKLRILKALLSYNQTEKNFIKNILKEDNTVLKLTAVKYWRGNLPDYLTKEINSTWKPLQEAVFNKLHSSCSPLLHRYLPDILKDENHNLYISALTSVADCGLNKYASLLGKQLKKKNKNKVLLFSVLASLKYKKTYPALKKEIKKLAEKVSFKKQYVSDKAGNLKTLLTALNDYGYKNDDIFFMKLATKKLPYPVFYTLIKILMNRCPAKLSSHINGFFTEGRRKLLVNRLRFFCKNH